MVVRVGLGVGGILLRPTLLFLLSYFDFLETNTRIGTRHGGAKYRCEDVVKLSAAGGQLSLNVLCRDHPGVCAEVRCEIGKVWEKH